MPDYWYSTVEKRKDQRFGVQGHIAGKILL